MKNRSLKVIILLIFTLIIGVIPTSAIENRTVTYMQLKDVPIGSIVYDPSWTWIYKNGDGYSGDGVEKLVEWMVVARDHIGYPNNSTTLLSNELIGKYYWDDSTNRGQQFGCGHWGDSGTGNARHGIRKFLNGSSYKDEDVNTYPITFYDAFGSDFKNIVLDTSLDMKTWSGDVYTTTDKVFVPAMNELGEGDTIWDEADWGCWKGNISRKAKLNGVDTKYSTRTPYYDSSTYWIGDNGNKGTGGFSDYSYHGVRPVVNVKSDIYVKFVGDNKYEIVHSIPLKDVPVGSIVYDPTWKWEHRPDDKYTGKGVIKSVEWVVVAKDHIGYPTDSVTLLSDELIGKYCFDDSTDRTSSWGVNHWGDSGTGNAKHGIRKFLNGDSYNGFDKNIYNDSFYNKFSDDFKDLVLETTLNMRDYHSGYYISEDNVFLPSVFELGGRGGNSDGVDWGYFDNDLSRIAQLNGVNIAYRTRTPRSGTIDENAYVSNSRGDIVLNYGASYYNGGMRPVVNLKSDALVKPVGNKYEIVYYDPPSIEIVPYDRDVWLNRDLGLNLLVNKGSNPIKDVVVIDKGVESKLSKEGSYYKANVLENGEFTFKVTDIYGMSSELIELVNNIDKVKPEIQISIE